MDAMKCPPSMENPEFHSSMLEKALDIILAVAPDGRILYFNQAAENAYHYSTKEFCDLTIFELRAPATHDTIHEQLRQAQTAGILFRTYHRRRNGELFPVEVNSRQIGLGDSKIVVSVIREISHIMLLERTLKPERLTYKSLYEKLVVTNQDLTAAYSELLNKLKEFEDRQETIDRQNNFLKSLHNATLAFLRYQEPHLMLQQILACASWLAKTPHAFILRFDTARNLFIQTHGTGLHKQDTDREFPCQNDISGIVFRTLQPVIINNYGDWRNSHPTLDMQHSPLSSQTFFQKSISAVLQVPLKAENELVGIIGLTYYKEAKIFSPALVDAVLHLAELASPALDNALLIDKLKTKLDEQTAQLNELRLTSLTDSLTGLYNRLYFEEKLLQIEHSSCSPGILLCNVDGLKSINDNYGYTAGDSFLKDVASCLQAIFTKGPVVARLGGSLFAVLCFDTTALQLKQAAYLVRLQTEANFPGCPISLSLGYALAKLPVMDGMALFEAALQRMQQEKALQLQQSMEKCSIQTSLAALKTNPIF